jgi:hypothetical protein
MITTLNIKQTNSKKIQNSDKSEKPANETRNT